MCMGLLLVTYDGIVGEPVKRLNFVMIKRVLGSNPVELQVKPPPGPPPANELDFGAGNGLSGRVCHFFLSVLFSEKEKVVMIILAI